MVDLKKAFKERDEILAKLTIDIFEQIQVTLECVTLFLKDTDSLFDAGIISWEDVSLLNDDIVSIFGMLDYDIGTTLEIDNETILITKENIEYFKRIVHMQIPYELVMRNNPEEIMDFLYNVQTAIPEELSEPLYLEQDVNSDFDLTKLTDKQREALMFFNYKEKN